MAASHFSPHGLWVFWSDLIATFWRGEVEWHGRKFDWEIADRLYAVSSLMFILAAILGLRKQFTLSTFQRRAIAVAIVTVVAGIAFLGLLSIQFDFGSCVNPSRLHPFHIGPLAERRDDSFCTELCLWDFLLVPPRDFKISSNSLD